MSVQIDAKAVKRLRDATGAGIMDCKRALKEADGDFDKAVELLRVKGQASAAKRGDREAAEGIVASSISEDNSTGTLVEIGCETDFVARNDDFAQFGKELTELVINSQTPEGEGDVEAFKKEELSGQTVEEARAELASKTGENVVIKRFTKFVAGAQGKTGSYIHAGGKVGVLVQVSSQSESGGDQLTEFARDLALHIAAAAPECIAESDISEDLKARELKIYEEQAQDKPEHIRGKVAEGRLKKWLDEVVLLKQEHVNSDKYEGKSIDEIRAAIAKELGSEVKIDNFVRYQVGE